MRSPMIGCAIVLLLAGCALGASAGEAAKPGPPGTILREYWSDLPGADLRDLTENPDFPGTPSGSELLKSFEGPTDTGESYGALVHGWIYPPATGNYVFWIASDDASELRLSTSEKPGDVVAIAHVSAWTAPRAWDANPEQQSKPIALVGGKKYYIEALHKQGGGGANLAVGWQLPDGTKERPIPGRRLSPAAPTPVTPPPPPAVKLLDKTPTTPGQYRRKAEITMGKSVITMGYLIELPPGYDQNTNPFPLITFLHGNSHQGDNCDGLLNEGPAQETNNHPELRKALESILFIPQCPADRRWDNRGIIRATAALLDAVCNELRVDQDRVYCTGLSMGGLGTWMLTLEAPKRFAAIVTFSAVAVRPEEAVVKLHDMPIWIVAGGDDGGFMEGSKAMKAAFDAAGSHVQLSVVPHEGHGVWARYYYDPVFYHWFLQNKRGAWKGETPAPAK